MATSTRLFQGRVVEDSAEKKENHYYHLPSCSIVNYFRKNPSIEEYKKRWKNQLN